MIHARLVIEAVEISRRNKLDQVSVALVVLTEQHKMIRAFGIGAAALVVIRRDIHLAADDRLNAMCHRLMVKVDAANRLPWSVTATAGIFRRAVSAVNSPISQAPSRRE